MRLIAYVANDPERIRCVLSPGRAQLVAPAEGADSWGVGFYQGGEVLLQRRPKAPSGPLDFYQLAPELRTDLFIGHVRHGTVGTVKNENTHPFRFRSWLFAHHGTIERWEAVRAAVEGAIPDFLRRNIRGQTDSEHLMHLFLGYLHEANKIDDPLVAGPVVAEALSRALAFVDKAVAEAGGQRSTLNVAVTNGRTLWAARHGAPMYLARTNGVRDCPVCRPPGEAGREPKRVDHEHLRGAVIVTDTSLAASAPWEEVPDGHVVTVSHEMAVKVTPY